MMKTLTLNQQNMIRRVLLLLLLMAAFLITFVFAVKPAHAYEVEGEYAVGIDDITIDESGATIESVPTPVETQFYFYKIGTFARDEETGKAYLQIDSEYGEVPGDVDVTIDKDADKYKTSGGTVNETLWTQDWLASAQAMWNYIRAGGDQYSDLLISSFKSAEDGKFTVPVDDVSNGLYLLAGDSQVVNNYLGTGKKAYWWPQPMFVLVWNGDVELGVKPLVQTVSKFQVMKQWSGDDDVKNLVRPSEIKVDIYYGDQDSATKKYSDVVLNDENDWTFSWESEKGKNESDPSKWFVVEQITDELAQSYESLPVDTYPKDDDGNTIKLTTITNTYDRHKIKITKTLNSIIDHGVGLNNSLVFELTGKDANGDTVYHKYVGLEYSITDGKEKSVEVENIPRNVQTLVVEEVYSGNHEIDETSSQNPQTIVFSQDEEGNDSQSGTEVTVEDGNEDGEAASETADSEDEDAEAVFAFANKINNKTHISGIINKYKLNDNGTGFVYQNDSNQGESNE